MAQSLLKTETEIESEKEKHYFFIEKNPHFVVDLNYIP